MFSRSISDSHSWVPVCTQAVTDEKRVVLSKIHMSLPSGSLWFMGGVKNPIVMGCEVSVLCELVCMYVSLGSGVSFLLEIREGFLKEVMFEQRSLAG